jgi:nucleotide-binding universal stress UspA family protein
MSQIKKILVAMASTEYCRGIFDYATSLAEALGADILVASIVNTRDINAVRQVAAMGYDIDGENYIADVKTVREQDIEAILNQSAFPRERVRIVMEVGNPVVELLKIVIRESVDMVVMGTKGRTNLEHILMGSVAEKMFRRCPVTIVSYRDESQGERLRKRIHAWDRRTRPRELADPHP